MKSIEIATAHNIVVTQELASLGQRIVAFGLDGMIIGLYSLIISSISASNVAVSYVGIGLVAFFYHLVWEVFNNGQSPGKRAMHLRVVSIQGLKPSLQDLFLRWTFRLIDITLSAGSLAILAIVTSPKNQRIGDLLASTTVINLRTSRHIELSSLQQIGALQGDVLYPGIVRYRDSDMLFVKQALQRYAKEQNAANTKIIMELYERISRDLGITPDASNKIQFLKKALADYIILTR
ncbi:MAG: RDD family protein [Saprospiraceae bacterium]|nr:RDD family protein [Saprospiraceae bacterium]